MKGNVEKTVELSLLGVAKALQQDVEVVLGDADKTSPKKYRVVFPSDITLDTREASRERRPDDFNLSPDRFNSHG